MSLGIEQDELAEILEEFFTEADENLDQLEQDLIQLEALAEEGAGGAKDQETVNRIFRVLHTLKGGAGFLGLERMAKLAHAGENLLDEVRNGKVPVTKPVMDALLQTTDLLKELLGIHKNRGDDARVDTVPLVAVLEKLATGEEAEVPPSSVGSEMSPQAPIAPAAPASTGFNLMDSVLNDPTLDPSRDKGEDGPKPVAPAAPAPSALAPEVAPASDMVNVDLLASVLNDPTLDPSRDKGEDGPKPAASAPAPVPAPVVADAGPLIPREAPAVEHRAGEDRRQSPDERRVQNRRGEEGGETIRVETGRLDKVMNLVGELVLARNSLVRQLNVPAVRATVEKHDNAPVIYGMMEHLSRVTQDLQMSVLSTRMQPIKKVFDKIPRQVRELKTKLGKEVNLIIEGEMTEVDKTLVEELSDPMVHMIRNALDHGLERPEERLAAGKHPEGTLVVRAFYEGNNVVIQVQEDGKGIDPYKIRQVAIKKGVVTEAVAMAMSDAEAVRLIMAPGFSTAEKVTDVSGRGVGMDVVNSKILGLQGSVDIQSENGMGTCFSIYLPLTLAIVNALIVGSNKEGFAIPIGDIAEVIKFAPDDIHSVNDKHVIELRGEPLPLYYLAMLTRTGYIPGLNDAGELVPVQAHEGLSLDDLESAVHMATKPVVTEEGADGESRGRGFVVVVREGNSSVGLVVDQLLGQEEVVVKAVTSMFEFNKAISGATITGDGKVHMILDVPYLLKELSGTARARVN